MQKMPFLWGCWGVSQAVKTTGLTASCPRQEHHTVVMGQGRCAGTVPADSSPCQLSTACFGDRKELSCELFHSPVFFLRQCFWSGTASMTLCLAGWVTEYSLAHSSKWSSEESGKLFSLWGRWCQIGSFKMMAWEWLTGHGTLKYLLFVTSLKFGAHKCCFSTCFFRESHTHLLCRCGPNP